MPNGIELEPEPTLAELIADELRDNPAGLPYYRPVTPEEIAEIADYNERVEAYNTTDPPPEELLPLLLEPAEKLKAAGVLVYVLIDYRTKPNPITEPPVVPIAINEDSLGVILDAVTPQTLGSQSILTLLPYFAGVIRDGNKKSAKRLFRAARRADPPLITREDAQTLNAMMNATMPDPGWTPTVPDEPRSAELWQLYSLAVATVQQAINIVEPPPQPIPGEEPLGPGA